MIVSHGTCKIYHPAPSMNKNISNIKYSHNMDTYNVQYVRHTPYKTNMDNMSNMSKLSKYVKINKDKFFYIFLENPAPTCQKLGMEK